MNKWSEESESCPEMPLSGKTYLGLETSPLRGLGVGPGNHHTVSSTYICLNVVDSIIQNEVSQKEKDKYCIFMHIYEI